MGQVTLVPEPEPKEPMRACWVREPVPKEPTRGRLAPRVQALPLRQTPKEQEPGQKPEQELGYSLRQGLRKPVSPQR